MLYDTAVQSKGNNHLLCVHIERLFVLSISANGSKGLNIK